MQIIILPEAEAETTDASLYYEGRVTGLGGSFEREVHFVFTAISAAPEIPRVRPRGYRRVNLKRFPYYVAYMLFDGMVIILAVGHGARRPEYWTTP